MLLFKRSISEDELEDLHGKVAIVTGGNTGVGYATIQFLARKGAKVYMAARDEGRALAAIQQLKDEQMGDGSVHWLKLDLSDHRSAKKAGEEFLQLEKRLDILVNNAARGAVGPFHLDDNGLLDIMVTNHISHFAFTEALLPLLRTTAQEDGSDVRIISVSSVAHTRVSPDSFVGKESCNKNFGESVGSCLDTYGTSKLANILHNTELQRRFDRDNIPITCISLHPGGVKTVGWDGFVNSLPSPLRVIFEWIVPFLLYSWREGAMNSAFAAASKEVKLNRDKYKGVYLLPIAKIAKPSKYAVDERLATELYQTTLEILKE